VAPKGDDQQTASAQIADQASNQPQGAGSDHQPGITTKDIDDALGGALMGTAVGATPGGVLFNASGADKSFSRTYHIWKALGEVAGGLGSVAGGTMFMGGGVAAASTGVGLVLVSPGLVVAGGAMVYSGLRAALQGVFDLGDALRMPSSPPGGLRMSNQGEIGAKGGPHATQTVEPTRGAGELRRAGDQLESVHDVMANPSLLQGKSVEFVRMLIGKTPGWLNDVMRHSTTHPGGGWVFREMNASGTGFSGRMIQYHPGTHRHFARAPYWKVSGPGQGTIRIPVSK
jgi:hypothetical protein